MDELVSVVIPVHNGERFLPEALQSVHRQTYQNREVIVVDDGSTDSSASIASAFGARVLSQPNRGPSAARNLGLRACSGGLIAPLDADDLWQPEFLEVLSAYLGTTAEAEIAHCRHIHFLTPGMERPSWCDQELLDEPSAGVLMGSWIARRSVFERVGLFDESFRLSEDIDWLVRASDAGVAMILVPDLLFLRRVHGSNSVANQREGRPQMFRALRASVARKRAAGEGRE